MNKTSNNIMNVVARLGERKKININQNNKQNNVQFDVQKRHTTHNYKYHVHVLISVHF